MGVPSVRERQLMNVGQFVKADGSRPFRGTKEHLTFDLWQKKGSENLFVLVRRFRITENPILEWTKHPPSESVPVGYMVPIENWDERVDKTGILAWAD
jgi:hypothetical protein